MMSTEAIINDVGSITIIKFKPYGMHSYNFGAASEYHNFGR
jgi:hypothetical protein